MAIQGGYAPPGVYTQTTFDTPLPTSTASTRMPLLLGAGKETIESLGVQMVRGSSSSIDQKISDENMSGRGLLGFNPDGTPILGDFDGTTTKVVVQHFPIVDGTGSGLTAIDGSSITAIVNGQRTVVLSVDGAKGIIELASTLSLNDVVLVSYFFKRTDTRIENENVSSQVTSTNAELLSINGSFDFDSTSNIFILFVDGVKYTISLPTVSTGDRTSDLTRLVAILNNGSFGTLEASTYTDNFNTYNLQLTASGSLLIGNGTANSKIGFATNQSTNRNKTFYTNYYPLVDGTNGGITTTDVTDITVTVNDVVVQAITLDGSNGYFTLSQPPAVGDVVKVSYYYNSFRDQFDYIPSSNVLSVQSVSLVPDASGGSSSNFIEGVSWVLKDDKIVWGTATMVSNGDTSVGGNAFGTTQVTTSLKDDKIYLAVCSRVVDTSVSPARALPSTFKLPYQPVDGTGSGVATSRTDLVEVRVGYNIADALDKPKATVIRVNPSDSTITLADPVLEGQQVFATFYYNTLTDCTIAGGNQYQLVSLVSGQSSIGKYQVSKQGVVLHDVVLGSKSALLNGVDLVFPSGSELLPDAKITTGTPVNETVTVEFATTNDTPAIFVNSGASPYYIVSDTSSVIQMKIDDNALVSDINLSEPAKNGKYGGFAHITGDVLPYTATSGLTDLGNIATGSQLQLKVDNEDLIVTFVALPNATGQDVVDAINNASVSVPCKYTAMTTMDGGVEIVAGSHDVLTFNYVGNVTGSSGELQVVLNDSSYLTASDLASELQNQIANTILVAVGIDPALDGLSISVTANSDGCLVFSLDTIADLDGYGYIEFVSHLNPNNDFAIVSGIDTDDVNGNQTKFGILPVAFLASTTLNGAGALRERIVLRNRVLQGNNYFLPSGELGIRVVNSTILNTLSLKANTFAKAIKGAVVEKPSIKLIGGWGEQKVGDTAPAVKFYDGTNNSYPANDSLVLDISGSVITIQFTSSATGTLTSITENIGLLDSVVDQINTAISDAGLGDPSSANYTVATIEGAGVRIVGGGASPSSYIKVLSGTANNLFNVSTNQVSSSKPVTAYDVVSALMNHKSATFSNLMFGVPVASEHFFNQAVAFVQISSTNKQYVGMEALSVGVGSSIEFTGGNAITSKGNGLKISIGDGSVGEAGFNGFFVKSSVAKGSGSTNTSILNSGVGQDGVVGQTYIDAVTGLSFTILERDGGIAYPDGATFTFIVSQNVTCNSNLPKNLINGISLLVSNTEGVVVGDTAFVETFDKGGDEPTIGQIYYISYTQEKTDFNTKVFTNISDVVNEYGDINPNNPLSLGAYLCLLNGASSIACKQIKRLAGNTEITESQMIGAIDSVEGDISYNVGVNVLLPLIPATSSLLSHISKHCDVQSSLRYKAERTAVLGFGAGTIPSEAGRLASLTGSSRVRVVYPDVASLSLTDTLGNTVTHIVDGRYLAVAVAGSTTSLTIDSATPWESRSINGFNGLLRLLNTVQANSTAVKGVTILENQGTTIKIRHGLTTNMSSVLTRTPTIIQIADQVQRTMRDTLNGYIGIKFLPAVISQISLTVNSKFQDLVSSGIIESYTGLSVDVDPIDPTAVVINAYYKPIFPLLYIQFTFNLRSSTPSSL
jgi:hypothetical protein